MNPAIPTHTPRVHPLNYDALKNAVGCQSIGGDAIFASLPFSKICVEDFNFDSIEDVFAKPRTVDYCDGPVELGVPEVGKYATRWAVWVSDKGVRVGKATSIKPPANSLGLKSSLFPTTKPVAVTIGFTSKALMTIGVEVDGVITLKWFRDAATGETRTAKFTGISPVLFYNGLLYYNEEPFGEDLVCYYLNPDRRGILYARFSREAFAVERIIHSDLPVDLDYLVKTDVFGKFAQVLYGKTIGGENATLTSDQYPVKMGDKSRIQARLVAGSYAVLAVPSAPPKEDKATLSASIKIGAVSKLKVGSTITEDTATLTAEIISGIYE